MDSKLVKGIVGACGGDQKEEEGGKPRLSIVTCGHVNSGKSTTMAHLFYLSGIIPGENIGELKRAADKFGKRGSFFAFHFDKETEERKSGLTMNATTEDFVTDTLHYSLIDSPGHHGFIKNVITQGISQADAALLFVPANTGAGGYEEAVQKGDPEKGTMDGETLRHARLCHELGITQLIVVVNKMDTVDFSEQRYLEILKGMDHMLTKIGYKTYKIPFIPVSGVIGINLINNDSEKKPMPWWKGWQVKAVKGAPAQGVTLFDALNLVPKAPVHDFKKPFLMPVSGVYKITGVGWVVTGKVEQGIIKAGQEVLFPRCGARGKVFSVETRSTNVPQAHAGESIGSNVKGLTNDNLPGIGDIMCRLEEEKETGLKNVSTIRASVTVQDYKGALKVGHTPTLHILKGKAAIQMTQILWCSGPRTKYHRLTNPTEIMMGDEAEVIFKVLEPFLCTTYLACHGLGRMTIMDSNKLIMLGKVLDVEFAG